MEACVVILKTGGAFDCKAASRNAEECYEEIDGKMFFPNRGKAEAWCFSDQVAAVLVREAPAIARVQPQIVNLR